MLSFKVFHILGLLLISFSLSFVLPILVAIIYGEDTILLFLFCALVTVTCGVIMWLQCTDQYKENDLRPREAYIITVLFWVLLSLFSAMPFILSKDLSMDIPSAIFESTSGLTTTGATVLTNIESLPKSLLFYRQQLQWFGGIGVVVIMVAFLPMLGVGGMQLFRTEMPGGARGSKIAPRIAQTAKVLATIYVVFTVCCAVMYYIAGMSVFDAICHSFSTIAIGGFSTYDASIGRFDNPWIYIICMFFMLLSGINFALHFYFAIGKSLKYYLKSTETILYIALLSFGIVATVLVLYLLMDYNWDKALLQGSFQVVSMLTTTGFSTEDFAKWPIFLPYFLVTSAIIGGCAGSTAGGLKVIRLLYLIKQMRVVLNKMIHPNGIFQIKLDNTIASPDAINAVWGHFFVYVLIFYILTFLLMITGVSYETAWSGAISSLSNLGPALGSYSQNYASATVSAKWILSIAMIFGRLEMFTLLLLFIPAFWRK